MSLEGEGEEIAKTEAEIAEAIRRENIVLNRVKAELLTARKELDRALEVETLLSRFDPANLIVPAWTVTRPEHRVGRKLAIATLQFSDPHFDETINDDEILGYNRYDRHIAEVRFRALGEKTIEVARDYIGGVDYEGLHIIATGDVFSGDIHEELVRTNVASLYASCVHWVEQTVGWLRFLADDFGKVHVAAVVGNHGRNSKKPIYKGRAQNNIEWLFWHYVADVLAARGDDRITFAIANGLSANTTVYDTTYAFEHGEQFKGGTGISGADAPLNLGQHRMAVQRLAMGQPLTWMVTGHFHQYGPPSKGRIAGGSVKGYDEFAAGYHFRPEVPQQGFWVTTPERGPTVFAPIQVQDREAEGW